MTSLDKKETRHTNGGLIIWPTLWLLEYFSADDECRGVGSGGGGGGVGGW